MVQSDCIVLPTYYNEGVPRIVGSKCIKNTCHYNKNTWCMDAVDHNYNGFYVSQKMLMILFNDEKF